MARKGVLVVGGGLVGLSAALFLASHDVPAVLVERHPGSSAHPRAVGFLARTAEMYRAVGLDERIPPSPEGATIRRVRTATLAGTWSEELSWTPPAPTTAPEIEYSPCEGFGVAQDRLEPLVRERARELGADVRLATEMTSFTQDEDGVHATLRAAGDEYAIHADYLVAADGHGSPIRRALGVTTSGRGHLDTVRSTLFRAPLAEYLAAGIGQFEIEQPGFRAFLATYGDGRWLLIHHEEPADEDAERALVRRVLGPLDVPVEIVTTGRWEVSAEIADRFLAGRVLLAGDAAHTLPPNRGAYGVNTGIEDAHNLAWKLAAVLAGTSGPALLETYDAERRPVARLRHDQLFARADVHAGGTPSVPILDDVAISLGHLYRSAVLTDATDDLPAARRPDEWAGQPGTRAPHLRLTDGRSVLDLFRGGWVLVTLDARWRAATRDLTVEVLDGRLDSAAFRAAYGIGPTGAALVRPDGYLAWRAVHRPDDAGRALTDALTVAAMARTASNTASATAPR